ncbi:MAG: hypothetical protein KC503_22695, partial [Myxococcales bacterium]|nr:hypothetical protein [Myxococcales bacterium]
MSRPELELVVRPAQGRADLRAPLTRTLTTIGSAAGADIVLAGVPARWAVVQRDGDGARLRLL